MKKEIVVVGGGTAGWLTALFANKYLPEQNITVVASEEIGILGAGEGTVPNFVDMMRRLGISTEDLITHCKATLKLGIDFIGWGEGEHQYYHPFSGVQNFNGAKPIAVVEELKQEENLDGLSVAPLLARNKKVPFVFSHTADLSFNSPLDHFVQSAAYGVHFDARLLADFLKKVALNRGVIYLNTKLESLETDENNTITYLNLAENKKIKTDFVFDCSGLQRLLIGKHYKSNWICYKDKLPVDTAIPFFVPHDNNIEPSTKAIAMKYGWMWQIPVQDRYGCGYVFDSSYISEEEAKEEVEEKLGTPIESPRTFKFNAGAFDKIFVKNCLAVGLAQGFVEPLEATSIWQTGLILARFFELDGVNTFEGPVDKVRRDEMNSFALNISEKIVRFLQAHYITNRRDTEFWRKMALPNTGTEEIHAVLSSIETGMQAKNPIFDFSAIDSVFSEQSWLHCAAGVQLFSPTKETTNPIAARNYITAFKRNKNMYLENAVSHKNLVQFIKNYNQGFK